MWRWPPQQQSLILRKVLMHEKRHSLAMLANDALFIAHPVEVALAGSVLLRRAMATDCVLHVESGRVVLGLIGGGGGLEHQLGQVQGPVWLEAASAVLKLPSVVDAVAQTDVRVRRIPLAAFLASLHTSGGSAQSVLSDVSHAYRQQAELAVSRLAKGAEARCAEWLLRQAPPDGEPGCAVQLQQRKRAIAAQLGIAPETLSRVLRHLRELGLISGGGRTLQLLDPRGLEALADSL